MYSLLRQQCIPPLVSYTVGVSPTISLCNAILRACSDGVGLAAAASRAVFGEEVADEEHSETAEQQSSHPALLASLQSQEGNHSRVGLPLQGNCSNCLWKGELSIKLLC